MVLERVLESPLNCEEIQAAHPKGNQSWIFIGRTDVEAKNLILGLLVKKLTHWKRPWCWERLRAGKEGDNRGWDGWMASRTQWTWVWVNSRSWWWTGKPGMLQSMGLQRVRHDWVTELNWTNTQKSRIHGQLVGRWGHIATSPQSTCWPHIFLPAAFWTIVARGAPFYYVTVREQYYFILFYISLKLTVSQLR